MAIIAYKGKGKTHYSVTKRLDKLNAKLNELVAKDPNFENTFKPATTREEFDKLYTKYMVENADFVDIKENGNPENKKPLNDKEVIIDAKVEPIKSNTSFDDKSDDFYNDESLPDDGSGYGLDEMATKNVNTRDYVLDRGMTQDSGNNGGGNSEKTIKTNFDKEPSSWDEAFKIPEPDEKEIFLDENDSVNPDGTSNTNNTSNNNSKVGGNPGSGGSNTKFQKEAPLNSSFDSMSGGKQRRQSKRIATMAVDVLSKFTEITFVYFCNRDITHDRLIELQDEGLIDLDFLIELEAGQQQAIRHFFMEQRLKAEELSKLDKDDRDDLIEALTDVIMEKGIAFTPIQQLGVTFASIFIKKGFEAYTFSKINKGILEYAMNHQAGSKEQQPQATTPTVVSEQKDETIQNNVTTQNQSNSSSNDFLSNEDNLEEELKQSRQKSIGEIKIIPNEDNPFVEGVSVLG